LSSSDSLSLRLKQDDYTSMHLSPSHLRAAMSCLENLDGSRMAPVVEKAVELKAAGHAKRLPCRDLNWRERRDLNPIKGKKLTC